MAPTILLTETTLNNNLSPKINLYDLPILKSTQTNQEKTTTPINASEVAWSRIYHKQPTMDPTISAITRKYCDSCKQNGHLTD